MTHVLGQYNCVFDPPEGPKIALDFWWIGETGCANFKSIGFVWTPYVYLWHVQSDNLLLLTRLRAECLIWLVELMNWHFNPVHFRTFVAILKYKRSIFEFLERFKQFKNCNWFGSIRKRSHVTKPRRMFDRESDVRSGAASLLDASSGRDPAPILECHPPNSAAFISSTAHYKKQYLHR